MSYTTLIRAIHLQNWAGTSMARQKLPALVRRLVHATIDNPCLVQFPADEGTGRRGWDGTIENCAGNAWVPADTSVWEMGTDQKPEQKANDDYRKRTDKPGNTNPAATTFVFVTPRKWEGKTEWREARRTEGVWRDVFAWDSADLEEWLERAPAVDLWLARLLDKLPPAGVRDPLGRWKHLASISVPPLTPEVFLAGRHETVSALRDALVGPPQEFAVAATSAQELADFTCAVFEKGDEEEQDAAAARALVVTNAEAWSQLVASHANRLFLIPGDHLTPDARMVAEAVNAGHSVLTTRPYTYLRAGIQTPRLPRAPQHELQQALEAAGFDEGRAMRLAHESAGSLTILVRLSSRFAGQAVPIWAQPDAANPLLPLVLLGAWVEDNAEDRRCVERLSGQSYEDLQQHMRYWQGQPDGPLRLTTGICTFASREESWQHLAPLLTRDLLDRFAPLVLEVLGEDDPRFTMPVEDRHMAGIWRKEPRRSHQLRAGVAETLALLGARGENVPHGSPQGSAWRANRAVEALLGGEAGARPERWFSLSHLLPTLAEAAPDGFLDALTADLDREQPCVAALFPAKTDASDPWFSSSNYTGLLWALQRMGWSEELMPRVAMTLAALVRRNFHCKSSPVPGSILHDLFSLWCPHTDTSEAERCEVLDLIVTREPLVAWKLLLGLIPSHSGFIMGGSKPEWRSWGTRTPAPITNVDLWRQIDWVSQRLIDLTQGAPQRWIELLDESRKLSPLLWNAVLGWLRSLDARAMDADMRLELWTTLRRLVSEHRFYHDAKWAFSSELVDELAKEEARLAPEDPSRRYRWLFDGAADDCFGDMATPREERQSMVTAAKRQAVGAIFAAGGLKKLIALAETAGFPGHIGSTLLECDLPVDPSDMLPACLIDERPGVRVFARCYAIDLRVKSPLGPSVLPLETWPDEAVAEAMACLPFSFSTWEEIRRRRPGAEALYWQKAFIWGGDLDAQGLSEALTMLRLHGRVLEAADLLASSLHRSFTPDWQLVADLIEEVLRKVQDMDPPYRWNIVSIHDLCEMVRYVQDAPGADPSRVAALEWNFLPLGHHSSFWPKHLHGELAANPKFFVEVLTHLFKPRSQRDTAEKPSETERSRALFHVCYELLNSWTQLPGTQPDGTIDLAKLQTWVDEVRQLCAEVDRAEIGDSKLGELLSCAPGEPDGSWPCIPVREILEAIRTEELLRGFKLGIFNSRGIISKTLNEGGEQERTLSARYRAHADRCRTRWPYTARALRDLADSYEKSARSEDERADGRDR